MDDPEPLVWLHGEIKTPPFSSDARLGGVFLLRRLHNGEKLSLPQSRPMPVVGLSCHDMPIRGADPTWRVIDAIDHDVKNHGRCGLEE